MKFLLENKVNINVRRKTVNYTPFIVACLFDFVEIIKILLDFKADTELEDINGFTGLMIVCQ